jgi:cell division septum initiation protein DivIVA
MKIKLGAIGLLLAATAMACAEMRTWTLNSGTTMEAEIVGFPDAATVKVKRSDGKIYSLPFAYVNKADQAYLAAEHAKQWKKVSIDELLGTASAGYYKKCRVSGSDVNGTILVQLVASQAEAVLNTRKQQADEIADLTSRLRNGAGGEQGSGAAGGGRGHRHATRAQAQSAAQAARDAQIRLDKLKADYAQNLKKTKGATTVLMKATGSVYDGLAVWECEDPRKAQ